MNNMRIYLAARYSRHPEMRELGTKLNRAGFDITSRWIGGNHELRDAGQEEAERVRFAAENFEDITKSDCIISFTETPDSAREAARPSKGGRHAEFGIGLAFNKRMILVGPREHIFHWLPNVEVYPDFDTLLVQLKKENKR